MKLAYLRPILVVDDEPGIREVVRLVLESRGHAVEVAADAAEARRLLAAAPAPPRAILLDVVLPGEDGLSLCRALKADPRLAEVPVLMITGRVRRGDRERARAAGADDLFAKPFDERAVCRWLDARAAA